MGLATILGSLFSVVGGGVKGFFGVKEAQAQMITQAIQTIGDVESSQGQRETAIAQVLASEASSHYWLAACWRPLLMLVFGAIIVSFWLGYVPPHFNDPMSPMMASIFDLIKLGMGGYIGGRTLEKVVDKINVAAVIKGMMGGRK